jgi:hypothetical protein
VTCWWCGAEATRLCDVLIGMERRKDNTLILQEPYTCDAEFCAKHGRQVAHLHLRGTGKKPDSVDACCEHVSILAVRLEDLAASAAAADKVRRDIRAKANRSRMRLVRTL